MQLCRALDAWLPVMPFLVVEVLEDQYTPSGSAVASNGTAHADRIQYLRKIYLIEPAVRQVVRVTCLRNVSRRSTLSLFVVYPLLGHDATPLFAGAASLVRVLRLHFVWPPTTNP